MMVAMLLVLPDLHVLLRVAGGAVIYVLATFLLKAVSFGDYRSLFGRMA